MLDGVITKARQVRKEIVMSHNQEAAQGNGDRGPRINRFWRVVLWVTLIVLAVAPYPWWL